MARGDEPNIGVHVACLNLFLESDGKYYLTVAGGGDNRPITQMMELCDSVCNPPQALAVMIEQAGPRFVATWRDWEPRPSPAVERGQGRKKSGKEG